MVKSIEEELVELDDTMDSNDLASSVCSVGLEPQNQE